MQGEAYGNINQAYAGAQPYQEVATGLGLSGANAVNPNALTAQNINQYMSPYLSSVVGTTMANLRQQQAEEQSKILGNQITSGAFGGDRGRIAQANLARQQELATGQTVAGLMNQGYGQALTTAQQQQAQQLAAEQANRAARATTAQQLAAIGQQGFAQGATTAQQKASLGQQAFGQGTEAAKAYQGLGQGLYGMGQEYGKNVAGLGTQAFDTALKGAQAQIGAGTLEQQTQQAQNTADYNQFLQQQGYPFQVAQFLANIAMGTGALSGSSQQGTTTSPQSFFSDRRLKDDVEKIGKTFDGQDIVRYKYKGEPGTRIGLIAQDVEKHHPDAVGLAGGYRTVDYDKATDDAAKRGHFAGGGLAGGYSSEGGAVMPEMAGMGFAAGGAPDINSMMAEILNAHQGMYPYGKAGMYGQTSGRAGAYGTSQMQTPTRGLMRVDPSAFVRASEAPSAGGQAMQGLNAARNIGSAYTEGSSALFGSEPTTANPRGGSGIVGRGGEYNPGEGSVARFGRWVQRQFEPSQPPANTPQQANTPQAQPARPADRRPDEVETPNATVVEASAITGGTNAAGGLVRGHYAMGGLPFSEAGGYIPEGVLNDNEAEKNKKAMDSFAPKSPGSGQSGSGSGPGLLGGLGQIGGAIGGAKALGSAASAIGEATGATEAISAALPTIMSFFSDRRLKDDIEKIGKTFDGQDIVRYRYKGEPATQIGLIAQDVEKHHPDAVGLAGGYRTVDYRKATEEAADRGHFAGGGLAGMRQGYQRAGEVVGTDPAAEPPVEAEVPADPATVERMTRRMVTSGLVPPPQNAPHLDPYAADRAGTAQLESGNRNVRNPNSSASGPLQITNRLWNDIAPSLNLSNNLRNDPTAQGQVFNAVRSRMEGRNGPMTGAQFNGAWLLGPAGFTALQNADPNESAHAILSRVDPRNVEAMFDGNSTILNRNMTAAEALQAAITRRGLGGGNTQSAGLAGPQNTQPPRNTALGAASNEPAPILTPYQGSTRLDLTPERRPPPNWMQRHQDWLVPLLSGVGAMASSPSRYFGSALLQGLAGGAQQYASMQNKAEEQMIKRGELDVARANATSTAGNVDTARAQEERARQAFAAATAVGAYNADSDTFRVYDRNGRPTVVRSSEFYRALREGTPYSVTPYGSAEVPERANQPPAPNTPITREQLAPPAAPPPPASSTPANGTATPPQQAGTPPATPDPNNPNRLQTVPTPVYQAIPSDLQGRLQSIATHIQDTPRLMREPPAQGEDPYPAAAESARVAQDSSQQLNSLASQLGSLPSSGLLTPGALQPVIASAVGTINSLLSSVGSNEQLLPQELGTSEGANKISRGLALELQRGSGSRAFQELAAMLQTVPTAANSPEGASRILSDIYVGRQRSIDMNNFYTLAQDQLRSLGLNEHQLRHANQTLSNEFARRQDANYGREREHLREMFTYKFRDPNNNNQEIPLVPYIIQNASNLSPEFRRNIEGLFGPGILRYFTGQ